MSYRDSEIKLKDNGKIRPKGIKIFHHTRFKENSKRLTDYPKLKQKYRLQSLEIRFVNAVNTNNIDLVETILDLGISPDTIDSECRSVLHIAVSRGYANIVELLLKYGANPNKRDIIQNTPLHLAACVHNLAIVTMLINAKADVSCLDLHGRNPFQLASSKLQRLQESWKEGAIEMVKLRQELKEVVDLLLSMLMRDVEQQMEKITHTDVDDLQIMKLSLNSDPPEELDNQISRLLNGIEKFTIK